jgi:hypothetical protein
MKILASIVVCSVQAYVLWMIFRAFSKRKLSGTFFANPTKARVAIYSLAIVGLLEFATTLYDINGPGTHFPLEIRVPVLIFETILMLRAL